MVESITEMNESAKDLGCFMKQISSLQTALDDRPFPQRGETWYLISSKWWRSHVVHRIPTHRVDNSDIIDPETERLKPDLIEGPFNDYVVVHAELWQQIKSGFEIPSGSEIARTVIEEADGSARVEVYPFEFQVRLDKMNGVENVEFWKYVTFSCKDTMSTIRSRILQLLNIPDVSDLRWWRKSQQSSESDLFQLVDSEPTCDVGEDRLNPHLDQVNVATGDFIVVQYKRPDQPWPNELPPSSFIGSRKFFEGQSVSVYMQEKWHHSKIVEINFKEQKLLVQPIGLPDTYARYCPFNSPDIKTKDDLSAVKAKSPSSPESSSSSGSFTRSKRVLEGDPRTGTNGFVPVASRLRLGRGIKGLQNLGNTCFMASTLQCLNRTLPFTEYFISKEYERDLNFSNPLGMKGQLAKEYAKLLHEIWFEPPDRPSGGSASIAPFGIKKVIATHAPRFSGFRQHDSQELLAFLLDGLHEDVNRVTNKPYTSSIESDGRDDDIVAEESWNTHLARNRSIVVDLFQGQLKSSVACPKCERISVTFDPMMYLSLPLAPLDVCSFSITVVHADLDKKPHLQSFEVSKLGNISDLVSVIGQRTGIRADHLLVCEVYANDVHKVFSLSEKVSSISPTDAIFVYEIESSIAAFSHSLVQWVKHAHVSTPSSTMIPISSSVFFAYPRPIFIPRGLSASALHAYVLKIASSLCSQQSGGLSADDVIVKIAPKNHESPTGPQVIRNDDSSEWNLPSNVAFDIIVHWSAQAHAAKFDTALNVTMRSMSSRRQLSPDVSLQDCIELFTQEEILSKEESWYCSSCKEHQQATKKFDLWKLPKILIVHLKRFQYTTYSRSKLDNYVDYPIEALDLTQFVRGPQRDSPVIYDLYAVSNHYGGFGGGHYTAYGKVSDNQWYSFDDSSTHSISVDQIKTRAAYVLFYQLRESTDSSLPCDQDSD